MSKEIDEKANFEYMIVLSEVELLPIFLLILFFDWGKHTRFKDYLIYA